MWTEEEIHNRWSRAKFPCRLLASGLAAFGGAQRDRHEVARIERLTPGKVTLTLGHSTLLLARGDREILAVPLRNLSSVRAHSVSVDWQLLTNLIGSLRAAAWFGVAKTAFLVFVAFSLIEQPRIQVPMLAARLPYFLPDFLTAIAGSWVAGFFLHLPFRFVPAAWRIAGRSWRLRFETMDGHAFNTLMGKDGLDRIVPCLRSAGLIVYIHERRMTLLDRGWAHRMRLEKIVGSFLGEIF